jgi:hypothetical protein
VPSCNARRQLIAGIHFRSPADDEALGAFHAALPRVAVRRAAIQLQTLLQLAGVTPPVMSVQDSLA